MTKIVLETTNSSKNVRRIKTKISRVLIWSLCEADCLFSGFIQ